MNENIDLTKILEGCPEGTEFYHLIYGKVYFTGIELDYASYPIRFTMSNHNVSGVTRKGLYNVYYNGECLLFPSKDQRDWSKFERFWDKPKIERFDINTFQPFDKVLVKYGQYDKWLIEYFGFVDSKNALPVTCLCNVYRKCIPYNDETKHLLGTTSECPEYYRWWEE